MSPTLAEISAALSTHRHLTQIGMSNQLIAAKHRRGELIRLSRGVYLDGHVGRACTPYERALAVTAALAQSRKTAVVSHQSAALIWGAPLLRLPSKVHLSLLKSNHTVQGQASIHNSRPEVYERAVELHGIKVTDPLTTSLDCIRTLPIYEALAITDYFLRCKRLDDEQVREAIGNMQGRGCKKARVVASAMSSLSESPLESLARLRLVEANMEAPVQQYAVVTSTGRRNRPDFVWLRLKLILEVDGLHKYYGAYRPAEEQLRRDVLRQRELELAGWRVVRAAWDDLFQRPDMLMRRLQGLGVGLKED